MQILNLISSQISQNWRLIHPHPKINFCAVTARDRFDKMHARTHCVSRKCFFSVIRDDCVVKRCFSLTLQAGKWIAPINQQPTYVYTRKWWWILYIHTDATLARCVCGEDASTKNKRACHFPHAPAKKEPIKEQKKWNVTYTLFSFSTLHINTTFVSHEKFSCHRPRIKILRIKEGKNCCNNIGISCWKNL